VYRRKGVDITIDQAREPMGAHKRVHIQQIARIPAVAERWHEVHGKPIGESDIDALFADFIPLQLDCLADYADLIPGTLEAVADFRSRGLKVGSTTGYTNEMMVLLQDEARKRGYVPDSTVCATDVPAGRPHPWMCLKNAFDLGIYPMESYVKVGDTLPDIAEGLNAGMWTIGLAKTGNEMGYQEKDVAALEPAVYDYKIKRAYERMAQAGAHYVVDSISEVPALLDEINQRLKQGERP
ncbi:MAG: phosphonoacetaldehyde hydrolase, partial [Candidatus Omnitrophica bacterium]|nr:phosphonoacetaldehyde hydrolase [Candidatus Omnitrophota bacterium]